LYIEEENRQALFFYSLELEFILPIERREATGSSAPHSHMRQLFNSCSSSIARESLSQSHTPPAFFKPQAFLAILHYPGTEASEGKSFL
jgi:hypothetical protein